MSEVETLAELLNKQLDDLQFLQATAEAIFQEMDQQEAANASRKAR